MPAPLPAASTQSSGSNWITLVAVLAIVFVIGAFIILAIRKSLRAEAPAQPHPYKRAEHAHNGVEPAHNGMADSAVAELAAAATVAEGEAIVPLAAPAAAAPAAVPKELEDERWETCEIVWWRGYRRSKFTAVTFDADGVPYEVASSSDFKWTRQEQPPREAVPIGAREEVVQALVTRGWEEFASGEGWYGAHYRRRLGRHSADRRGRPTGRASAGKRAAEFPAPKLDEIDRAGSASGRAVR